MHFQQNTLFPVSRMNFLAQLSNAIVQFLALAVTEKNGLKSFLCIFGSLKFLKLTTQKVLFAIAVAVLQLPNSCTSDYSLTNISNTNQRSAL